jgi:pimeloyl-ACP methyl ester carboxylesterase
MHKTIRVFLVLAVLLAVCYAAGPRPDFRPMGEGLEAPMPEWLSGPLKQLPRALAERESALGVPAHTAARIVPAHGPVDSLRRTPWAIVYLPGFSASHGEGEPLHRELALRYGANLLLARTTGHGFVDDPESFVDLTPADWLASAAEAVALGRRLGDSVLVMATSTGVTLALALAAMRPESIDALVGYSPNIAVADAKAGLLTGPWGLPIARAVLGGKHRDWSDEANDSTKRYWTTRYRLEGAQAMQALLDQSMTPETFAAVRQPCFFGVWYAGPELQDPVISVSAARKAFAQMGTPEASKRWVEWPDVGSHALASGYGSQDLESVRRDTRAYLEEVLGWRPLATPMLR